MKYMLPKWRIMKVHDSWGRSMVPVRFRKQIVGWYRVRWSSNTLVELRSWFWFCWHCRFCCCRCCCQHCHRRHWCFYWFQFWSWLFSFSWHCLHRRNPTLLSLVCDICIKHYFFHIKCCDKEAKIHCISFSYQALSNRYSLKRRIRWSRQGENLHAQGSSSPNYLFNPF